MQFAAAVVGTHLGLLLFGHVDVGRDDGGELLGVVVTVAHLEAGGARALDLANRVDQFVEQDLVGIVARAAGREAAGGEIHFGIGPFAGADAIGCSLPVL